MTSHKSRCLVPLLLAGALCAFPGAAQAGNFNVDPVHITLKGSQASVPIEITNFEEEPLSIRVSPTSWRQVDGEDVHEPTSDVIVSPPIFTIPAGGRQIVRLGLRRKGAAPAYRVAVQEIPSKKPEPGTVQVALEMNLPLYLVPDGKAEPQVSWSARQSADGELLIEGRNSGSLHMVIHKIGMIDAAGRQHILSEQMGVVLPSSAKKWSAGKQPSLKIGSELPLTLQGPNGETQVRVVVEKL